VSKGATVLEHRSPPSHRRRAGQTVGHPAGPAPTERGELAELGRMLLRTVLPASLGIGVVLAVYGGTGHDIDIILQDRFPDVSEYSGLLTIAFGTAVLVCAGMALGSVVVSRAWFDSAANGATAPPAVRASLILSIFLIFIAFDDIMMVHDAMLTGAGIPEEVGLGAYVVVGVVLIAVLVRPIRSEGLGLCLLAALGLLGASLGGDIVESVLKAIDAETASRLVGYAEDAIKFVAYAAFCHLAVLLARRVFARTLQSATERAAREAVERAQAPAAPLAAMRSTPASHRVRPRPEVPPEDAGELTGPL
jgi:hypothetical protein